MRKRILLMQERQRMQNNKNISGEGIEERARFDIIRYANCWEDVDVLIRAIDAKEGGLYLSIASSGDNSLALLSKKPSLVLAIDINSVQLACVEIRKAAFKSLSYEGMLNFLGINEGGDRINLYRSIRNGLSSETRIFWDRNQDFIKKGIIHIGKFERYFHLFREYILPLIHSRKEVEHLLNIHDAKKRKEFYDNSWNTLRWKLLFKIFFSRKLMGRLGRDPEFFKYVETDVASRIFKRAEYALTELSTDTNPYLEYILRGNFKNALPFYLRRENFETIRNNLDKLVIFKGNLQEAFENNPQIKFDGFNLSDIFEYMSYQQYKQELERILNYANRGSRLVYWNMLAERKYVEGLDSKLRFLDKEANGLFKEDKAFFYKSLIIAEAI